MESTGTVGGSQLTHAAGAEGEKKGEDLDFEPQIEEKKGEPEPDEALDDKDYRLDPTAVNGKQDDFFYKIKE